AQDKSVPYLDAGKKGNSANAPAVPKPSIVRIMGRGQFRINAKILKRLDQVDASIVELVSKEKSDDAEFRKRLAELAEIVLKGGTPLPATEIIKSDVILPSPELSIDEAKKLFAADGVIPAF
ncbi:MAG TPA: hypothetical protein VFA15_09350, partial [Nitrososphaera sp.]|nr:hypothetical protein [Nitrososphaera sp.]